jgi:hypothetical protein
MQLFTALKDALDNLPPLKSVQKKDIIVSIAISLNKTIIAISLIKKLDKNLITINVSMLFIF